MFFFLKICFGAFCLESDRTVKVWTGNEMERRGGEWDREMTAGRIRTRVPVGQGGQTHFHPGPHQHYGCPQRAGCNFKTRGDRW